MPLSKPIEQFESVYRTFLLVDGRMYKLSVRVAWNLYFGRLSRRLFADKLGRTFNARWTEEGWNFGNPSVLAFDASGRVRQDVNEWHRLDNLGGFRRYDNLRSQALTDPQVRQFLACLFEIPENVELRQLAQDAVDLYGRASRRGLTAAA